MSEFGRRVVAWAFEKVGKPYIWGAFGASMWTKKYGVVKTFPQAQVTEAYDCIGLIKAASHACGGTDIRATDNAQTLFKRIPVPGDLEEFKLRFYGTSRDEIVHVSLDLGKGIRLEAAGPGSGRNMLTLYDVLEHPLARVRIGFEQRNDFIGYGSLNALEKITK